MSQRDEPEISIPANAMWGLIITNLQEENFFKASRSGSGYTTLHLFFVFFVFGSGTEADSYPLAKTPGGKIA
jgi:hypothetical protein